MSEGIENTATEVKADKTAFCQLSKAEPRVDELVPKPSRFQSLARLVGHRHSWIEASSSAKKSVQESSETSGSLPLCSSQGIRLSSPGCRNTVFKKLRFSWLQRREYGRARPASSLLPQPMRDSLSSLLPLPPVAGRRVSPLGIMEQES